MKILVCAKCVVDANVKVRADANSLNVDIKHSKTSLNPFDETAIEEAVRLKKANIATEICAISIGCEKSIEVLRTALARGCDRAIWVKSTPLEPINVAKVLKKVSFEENPDLILMGKQAIDDESNQVGQMLAGMLNYPQGTCISNLHIKDNIATITREIDNGTEHLQIELPAVLTVDLNLNEPSFIRLPQLILAKKKTIEQLTIEQLAVQIRPSSRLISARDNDVTKRCHILNSVQEVADIIKSKIK